LAGDHRAFATEHGNDFTALVAHLHVVNAVATLSVCSTPSQVSTSPSCPGFKNSIAAACRHGIFVVAVAGVRKGGVGESEDETAVADAVAVEVQRPSPPCA
jgi:hypothetical protein